MRIVAQRVKSANVKINEIMVGNIGPGLVLLLGIGNNDTDKDRDYLVEKIVNLRIFPDEEGKMNKSILDILGSILLISQFTLYGDCRKGRRPSYTDAAPPDTAKKQYEEFAQALKAMGIIEIATGEFQAHMHVSLVNDGPVTILLDSKKMF